MPLIAAIARMFARIVEDQRALKRDLRRAADGEQTWGPMATPDRSVSVDRDDCA